MILSQKTGSASIKCEYLLFLVGYGFADRINPFKLIFIILMNLCQDYLKTVHIDFKLTDDNVFEQLAKISGV